MKNWSLVTSSDFGLFYLFLLSCSVLMNHDKDVLTTHNWQKWKRVFLTCPCHEIFRDEADGLKSCKYIWKKLRFLWKCEIWGNFVKIWYFVNNCLRGYCTPGPYFWRLCAFSQKIKQLRTKYPMDLVRNVPRNSKITVLLQ